MVAVIDSGIDTAHTALRDNIWSNAKEIPANGVDDDHNGYSDDVHGWNYLGTETGKEDITKIVLEGKVFFDSLAYGKVPEEYQASYQVYRRWLNDYKGHLNNAQYTLNKLVAYHLTLDSIVMAIGKKAPSVEDFKNFRALNNEQEKARLCVLERMPHYTSYVDYLAHEVDTLQEIIQFHIDNGLGLKTGKDRALDVPIAPGYGNSDNTNDLEGPVDVLNATSFHGTHVSGIIAGKRTDSDGVHGIADHVQIMMLKVLSSIRELRDRDMALAIRYAVDNGAKVINLSFGKPYSPYKRYIDSAVRYAMQHDVLIVAGAGNQGMDLDRMEQYPSRVYLEKDTARAWLEVGASGLKDDSTLVASFSNYGQHSVDVFAPGVQIYSAIPGGRYAFENGTSMATPVVTGLAALIREYYPHLSAVVVKDIIMRSVSRVDHSVLVKDNDGNSMRVPFSRLCISGGIVNAYNALKLAEATQ